MLKHINSYENVVFIFDCDGVLLDYLGDMKNVYERFIGQILTDKQWLDICRDYELHPENYMDWGEFWTEFALTQKLPPVKGMPELVAELADKGADMCVLSSIDPEAEQARRENLLHVFGPVFSKVDCVGQECKSLTLEVYTEWYDWTIFIDDSIRYIQNSVDTVTHPVWFDCGYLSHRADELDANVYRAESVGALRDLLLF